MRRPNTGSHGALGCGSGLPSSAQAAAPHDHGDGALALALAWQEWHQIRTASRSLVALAGAAMSPEVARSATAALVSAASFAAAFLDFVLAPASFIFD